MVLSVWSVVAVDEVTWTMISGSWREEGRREGRRGGKEGREERGERRNGEGGKVEERRGEEEDTRKEERVKEVGKVGKTGII